MPALTFSYRCAVALRRFPVVHRPLKWLRRSAVPALGTSLRKGLQSLRIRNPRIGPPQAVFSIYDELKAGSRRGRIELETQGDPELTPDSMMVLCRLRQHLQQPWPIFWSHHPEARLITHGLVLLNEKKQIAYEAIYRENGIGFDPATRYLRLPPEVRLAGNWTSICSVWSPNDGPPNFSHWLLDALPRLAFLEEFPADTKILVPSRLAEYQKESLRMLGLLERVRYTPETHLVLENYFFSTPPSMVVCYSPYSVQFLRKRFLPKADPSFTGPKRFVIDRHGKTRGLKNRVEVNRFFEKLGWAIVDTEKLTFAQEIKLFAEAEAIAGAVGSGFTNAVWCKPGTAVIQILPETVLDGSTEWICQVNQLRWAYQICPSDHAFMADVDLGELRQILARLGLL
jgi:hypothetical protein